MMHPPKDMEARMRTTMVLATVVALALPALSAGAADRVPLHRVASQAGYDYRWSPVGTALVLSKPGTVVVLWPGAQVYQVNDHDEVTSSAPTYSHGDLFVAPSLATHLQALARRTYPTVASNAALSSTSDRSAQGAITLEARQLQGSESIDVEGTSPPGAPITITLLALVSSDVPTILVSRHDIVSDVNGRFGAVIPIASAFERGTTLRVLATSTSGVASAQAQIITGAPNAGVTVPLDSH
jgi:copper amine oxidase-like protein